MMSIIRSDRSNVRYEICGMRSPGKSASKVHMRTHTGEKSFNCSVRDRKFASKQYLNYHMRVHTSVNVHINVTNVVNGSYSRIA